jgi:hypothetical protein
MDRQSWLLDDMKCRASRTRHPGRYERRRLVRCPQRKMPGAVVHLVAHDHTNRAVQRVKAVGDFHLRPQTPGTMKPPRMMADAAGPTWRL